MESIWERDVKMPEFSGAEGKHKTDVLIIGGGMTGLLCGYFLKQQGADCVCLLYTSHRRQCGNRCGQCSNKGYSVRVSCLWKSGKTNPADYRKRLGVFN